MSQRSEMSWRLQTRSEEWNTWNTKNAFMSFQSWTSVVAVLVFRLFFGLGLFGCGGGGGEVQASPRHGFGLLHGYFDLGGHHVDQTLTHVYYLQAMKKLKELERTAPKHGDAKRIHQGSALSLTPHKLIFCSNSFSPSNTTWTLSWRTNKRNS